MWVSVINIITILLLFIHFQTVASADLKICDIVARWPGSTHDSRIWKKSQLCRRFGNGEFGTYILVGDSGYANTSYMATSFLNAAPNTAENLYNESQIRTRNAVECSYGVLKSRFPILHNGIDAKLDTVQMMIAACAVLHNISIDLRESFPVEIADFRRMLDITEMNPINHRRPTLANARNRFMANWFIPLFNGTINP